MADDTSVPDEIVDAARGYFLRFGYSRVSTGEIARSIGRSKKTLYKHFATKEALLQAVLARINAEVKRDLRDLLQAPVDAQYDQRLRRLLGQVAVHLASTGGVLFEDLRSKDPTLHESMLRERRETLAGMLRRVLEAGVEAGRLRRDLDLGQALTVFLVAAEALATPIDIAARAAEPDSLFQTLVTLVVDGLAAQPRR